MSLCNTFTAQNKECGSISGGIISVEFIYVSIEDYLEMLPDKVVGEYLVYYYRRKNKFFFRSEKNEKVSVITSALGWQTISRNLKRGQKFLMKAN